jgi:hypothetical protein
MSDNTYSAEDILHLIIKLPLIYLQLEEFKRIFDIMVSTFSETDQAKLMEAYDLLISDEDLEAAHEKLQARLRGE